jgi:hypothetical protein
VNELNLGDTYEVEKQKPKLLYTNLKMTLNPSLLDYATRRFASSHGA